MNQLLLVDFDGTLFNSDLFHNDIAKYLNEKYMLPIDKFFETFELAKSDNLPHSLKKQFKIIGFRNTNGLIKEIKDYLANSGKNYIFEESLDFIKQYKKNIIIYTYADPSYFKYKLAISKLSRLRIPSLIVNSDKNTFLKNNIKKIINENKFTPNKVVWIDDKVKVFSSAIENIEFVRIKREGNKHSFFETPKAITEINNLLELNIA